MRHLVSIQDLPNERLVELFDLAGLLSDRGGQDPEENLRLARAFLEERHPGRRLEADRVMASLFFEPSTRTRLSFEASMHRLGGRVIGFADARTTSISKGETLADTIRIIEGYADLIVIRHPAEGSAWVASQHSGIPIVNAGDGGREHPSQCLLDLFTLRRELGRIEGLKVGLLGDLKFGRTVHSLAQGLARLGAEVLCIAPESLRMPERILRFVEGATGRRPREAARPEEVLGELDALYVTRIQGERFEREEDYLALKGLCIVDGRLMAQAPAHCIVLHPLPRVDEISPEFDSDPRAAYFRQAHNGLPVRMALLAFLLSAGEEAPAPAISAPQPAGSTAKATRPCDNPRCILRSETYLPPRFIRAADGILACAYCETSPQQGELRLRY